MSNIKSQIKEKLSVQDLEGIEDMILEYQQEAPQDLELISIKVMYFLLVNDYEEALAWAGAGVRKNPYNTEANYNFAYMNEMMKNYYEAYIYYVRTLALARNEENQEILEPDIIGRAKNVLDQFIKRTEMVQDREEQRILLDQVETLQKDESGFGLLDNSFKDYKSNMGRYYRDYSGNKVYVGFYDRNAKYSNHSDNMIQAKGEMRPIIADGKQFQIERGCDRIIPILSKTDNVLVFREGDTEYTLNIDNPNHFLYFRVKPETRIFAENPICLGRPIPVQYKETKKKLVLSLFIDGLSQVVLNEEGFEKVMPNTWNFFRKGVICKNAYSASEWTYPGLTTYVTGLSTPNHMIIHNHLNIPLPSDVTLISEYFSEAGYQTAKMDGDWRSTPNYGYLRGVDRTIYQHQWTGMRSWEVVGDALEHMELLKETNHFLWLCIGDLHDIADEIDLQPSIESKLYVKERIVESGTTSAKQPYSPNKRIAYIHQAKMIDQHLGIIYRFIEENYREDEVVVSLFGDHGQGYLVKPNHFFLAPERTNVAFMFRGAGLEPAVSEELISSADYSTIMYKLCGIAMKDEEIDGRLPQQFGGDEVREYVITESIHPKDPYYASVYWKDYVFNFASMESVGEDGRFNLEKGYTMQLLNCNGQEFTDEEVMQRNLDIIKSHIAGILIYD